jgi:dolichyl-phosphate beta-glucosyltransferase
VGLSIVIPAYNESSRLAATLPRILEYAAALGDSSEVIVVDDGSTDGTAQVAAGMGRGHLRVSVLRSALNRGKGASVRRGVLAAREDEIVITDADLSAPIEEVAKLRAGLAGGYDVAIGSRRLAGSDVQVRQPWLRGVASRGFSRLVSLCFLPGIHDTQCGFKAFRRPAAAAVFARQRLNGYAFDVEVLWLARRLGYRVVEIPIVWRDDPRTHLRLARDSLGMLVDLARLWAGGRRGHYREPPGAAGGSGR